jgi:hypothetical protein
MSKIPVILRIPTVRSVDRICLVVDKGQPWALDNAVMSAGIQNNGSECIAGCDAVLFTDISKKRPDFNFHGNGT